MYEPHSRRSPRTRRPNVASCIVATVFFLFLIAAAIAVFFFLFKPKDPRIAVEAVQFPAFSVSGGALNFTLFQYASVTNPNRDAFTHYDSSLQLVYSGSQVGVVLIPAGEIGAGRTQHISAKFDVSEYPLSAATAVSGPAMEIETRMRLVGRVRVLKVLSHRVESQARCGVTIRVRDGSVLGFQC